ncbi:hypothetical protein [Oceanihabitans sediminis]|nr:hypothetical protein [Oceanihabitans sediminis]MDX1773488.1 hypothetical protein [Oceanihabitans sediminis]|tara:strand:- start:117 stop:242 length:126 start_codon:yes stop_codon:yes gene_type:complete
MAKQNNPRPKPSQKPSEPRHGGNKGRTTPKPPVRPKQSPSK